jgi:hypothetical protein
MVAGSTLLAVGPRGDDVRAVGAVSCASVVDVMVWTAHAAVRCAAEASSPERVLGFQVPQAPRAVVLAARPAAQPQPQHVARLHAFPVPPAAGFTTQWFPHGLAALADGSAVFLVTPAASNAGASLGYATAAGAVRIEPIPEPTPASWHAAAVAAPQDLIADAAGTVWFGDVVHPVVTSRDAAGTYRVVSLDAGAPPIDRRGFRPAPRITVGPDGQIWFARRFPRPQIGRVDGSALFDLPPELGPPLAFAGGPDALWFVTAQSTGSMTTKGVFRHTTLPAGLVDPRRYPPPYLAAGSAGTAWFSVGARLVEIAPDRVLRTLPLPTGTASVSALATGCDGTPYAVEQNGQLAHVGRDGTIEEVPLDAPGIMFLARGRDCRMWFLAGTNYPHQQVGTFELVARPATPR